MVVSMIINRWYLQPQQCLVGDLRFAWLLPSHKRSSELKSADHFNLIHRFYFGKPHFDKERMFVVWNQSSFKRRQTMMGSLQSSNVLSLSLIRLLGLSRKSQFVYSKHFLLCPASSSDAHHAPMNELNSKDIFFFPNSKLLLHNN